MEGKGDSLDLLGSSVLFHMAVHHSVKFLRNIVNQFPELKGIASSLHGQNTENCPYCGTEKA